MRLNTLLAVVAVILLLAAPASSQFVGLDHVDGLNDDGTIMTGQQITFYFGVEGDLDYHSVLEHPFNIFSPDGAEWGTTIGTIVPGELPSTMVQYVLPYGVTGSDADTIVFLAWDSEADGLPPGYTGVPFTIEIGPIDEAFVGKTIVIDSAFFPPAGPWMWFDVDVVPNWGGPYEFTIAPPDPPMITVDHVDGQNPDGTLKTGETITFYLRVKGDVYTHTVIENPFHVYSPDGAEWGTTVGSIVPGELPSNMQPYALHYGITGSDADTVVFLAWDPDYEGLPAGYEGVPYTIQIGPIDDTYDGKTIGLDSIFFPPAGPWEWFDVDVVPDWGGPYEYTIKSCGAPLAVADPGLIVTTLPITGYVDIYFGNFCNWDKTADDVDFKSVKVDAVKPRMMQVVNGFEDYFDDECIRASVSLKGLLKPYEPLTGDIEIAFEVTGKFLDKSRFSMIGDLVVIIYPGDADLNDDGFVNQEDVDLLVAYLYQDQGNSQFEPKYDVDGNGSVDLLDVVELNRLLAIAQ